MAKTRQGGYACWRGDRRGATVGEIGSIAGIVYKADVMIVCGDQQIRSEGRKKIVKEGKEQRGLHAGSDRNRSFVGIFQMLSLLCTWSAKKKGK